MRMDERLNFAPCGYLSLADDNTILAVNETLLKLLGYDHKELYGRQFELILAVPSRSFYQIYFTPLIRLNAKVEEMYLSLRSRSSHSVPVLLNAVRREREGVFVNECMLIPMRRRIEYEQQIAAAENAANKAESELNRVKKAVAYKQKELKELSSQLDVLKAKKKAVIEIDGVGID